MSIPQPGDQFLAVVHADPLVKAAIKLEARTRKAYDREPGNSALWIAWQKAAELTLWLGSAVATRNMQAEQAESIEEQARSPKATRSRPLRGPLT